MKTVIPLIFIIVLSLVVFIPQASACSCAADRTIEDTFAEADNVIFSGKVTGIKELQRTFLVTFEIDQSWKGIPDDVTDINTMTFQSGSMCGYNFTEDQSYLVEAHGKWDQTPEVSLCSSTTVLGSAQEKVSFLNKQTVDNFGKTVDNILSPLKQQQNGIAPNEIQCKKGLYRGFSESNGKAICATGYTISELIHRGWAESHTAISSATISSVGDGVRDYCPEGTQLLQGGWYAPFTKYPNVEQISMHELYDPQYDSQGIEFILNPLNDPQTYGKTMIFVFVDCDLSFDYFEVLILPNSIGERKNFVVHYPTTTTNTIHFDNQDDISYKIDGRTDSEVGSGDFTVWIDPQSDWFIEETANGYDGVSHIKLSVSNQETGEVYDWMNAIIYLSQEIED